MQHNLQWFLVDTSLVIIYGLQHSLLTTKSAVKVFNSVMPAQLWNISYSIFSVLFLIALGMFWQNSGITIYRLSGAMYYIAIGGMAAALFGFIYCFKYTTSFFQWIGLSQIYNLITRTQPKPYYRVRKNGPKKYIRFPHHLCLVLLFWSQPVMTLDTLWLAILATIYTYIGTVHQDSRGRRLLGDEWIEYSKNTNLMFPNPLRIARDISSSYSRRSTTGVPNLGD